MTIEEISEGWREQFYKTRDIKCFIISRNLNKLAEDIFTCGVEKVDEFIME